MFFLFLFRKEPWETKYDFVWGLDSDVDLTGAAEAFKFLYLGSTGQMLLPKCLYIKLIIFGQHLAFHQSQQTINETNFKHFQTTSISAKDISPSISPKLAQLSGTNLTKLFRMVKQSNALIAGPTFVGLGVNQRHPGGDLRNRKVRRHQARLF